MRYLKVLILVFLLGGMSCQNKVENNNGILPGENDSMQSKDMVSLQYQLDSLKNRWKQKADSQVIIDYQRGIEILTENKVGENALKEGDTAIDFSLPNALGNEINLYSLLDKGPVVVTWYRGGWCPYCNLELAAFQEILPIIRELGANLIAISPNLPDNSITTIERHNLEFEVLSDLNNKIAGEYGISYILPEVVQKHFEGRIFLDEYNGNDSKELPLAATYVIGNDRIIKYAFIHTDYRVRAEPADIISVLKKLI